MKFGKNLNDQIAGTLPAWRGQYISYKKLKKRLNLIRPVKNRHPCNLGSDQKMKIFQLSMLTREDISFIRLLEKEIHKFNYFFLDQEENYIIKIKEMQYKVASASNCSMNNEIIKLQKEIIDFHGEMVLLENYSALNYLGLLKILKKYEKRTRTAIRIFLIQRILQQPFVATDTIHKLIKSCETMLHQLKPLNQLTQKCEGIPEISSSESLYLRSSVSALQVLGEIRKVSKTRDAFSLPPL